MVRSQSPSTKRFLKRERLILYCSYSENHLFHKAQAEMKEQRQPQGSKQNFNSPHHKRERSPGSSAQTKNTKSYCLQGFVRTQGRGNRHEDGKIVKSKNRNSRDPRESLPKKEDKRPHPRQTNRAFHKREKKALPEKSVFQIEKQEHLPFNIMHTSLPPPKHSDHAPFLKYADVEKRHYKKPNPDKADNTQRLYGIGNSSFREQKKNAPHDHHKQV